MLWHGERNNETENKGNASIFIPGIVYAGNVSLLAIYWILIKQLFQQEDGKMKKYMVYMDDGKNCFKSQFRLKMKSPQ